MRKNEKFTYKGPYRTYEDCYFQMGLYPNGNLAIEIWSPEVGAVTRITVNPDVKINMDKIAIKDYMENAGMVNWLISEELIYPDPVNIIMSGWVYIPVHALTPLGREVFDVEK